MVHILYLLNNLDLIIPRKCIKIQSQWKQVTVHVLNSMYIYTKLDKTKDECSLKGNCMVQYLEYTMQSYHMTTQQEHTVGLAGGAFKDWYVDSHQIFHAHQIWKRNRIVQIHSKHSLKWNLVKRSNTNKLKSGQCLRLEGKLALILHKLVRTLVSIIVNIHRKLAQTYRYILLTVMYTYHNVALIRDYVHLPTKLLVYCLGCQTR